MYFAYNIHNDSYTLNGKTIRLKNLLNQLYVENDYGTVDLIISKRCDNEKKIISHYIYITCSDIYYYQHVKSILDIPWGTYTSPRCVWETSDHILHNKPHDHNLCDDLDHRQYMYSKEYVRNAEDYCFLLDCRYGNVERIHNFIAKYVTCVYSSVARYVSHKELNRKLNSKFKILLVGLEDVCDLYQSHTNTIHENFIEIISIIVTVFSKHLNGTEFISTEFLRKTFKILCKYNHMDHIKSIISLQQTHFLKIFNDSSAFFVDVEYPYELIKIINTQFPSQFIFCYNYVHLPLNTQNSMIYCTRDNMLLIANCHSNNETIRDEFFDIPDEYDTYDENMATYKNIHKEFFNDILDENSKYSTGSSLPFQIRIQKPYPCAEKIKNVIIKRIKYIMHLKLLSYGIQSNVFKSLPEDLS